MSTHLTETLWLDRRHPDRILDALTSSGASNRKLRLLGAACCRRVWHLLTDERSRAAVEAAESYADGLLLPAHLDAHRHEAWIVADALDPQSAGPSWLPLTAAFYLTAPAPHRSARGVFNVNQVTTGLEAVDGDAKDAHCRLLRDVFANPFRPVRIDPLWLHWNGGVIPELAQAAYDERELPSGHLDNQRLAVLADALEEAGCTGDVMEHCRLPVEHVRGCWALDLLLGLA